MKPAWDRLMGDYDGSSSVVVGDVDCTSDGGKSVCSDVGVQGYPTIKYWKDGTEEKYQGGRDYDSLKKFVEDELERGCDVDDDSSCSEKEQKYINKMKAKGKDAVTKQITRINGMKDKSMKPALKQWMSQRLHILTQLDQKTEL